MSKIIIGTAQFGLDYGINNDGGKPGKEKIVEILDIAFQNGIRTLDTAEAYGDAIDVIGKYHADTGHLFNVISKFKTGSSLTLITNVAESLKKLGIPKLAAYLLHDAKDLGNDLLLRQAMELKKEKLTDKVGVSVYDNETFLAAIQNDFIDIIQLPFNVFDNWNLRGELIEEAKRKGKTIHVRSVFLQGLLFMEEEKIPVMLTPLIRYIRSLRSISNRFRMSIQELALNYALSKEFIDGVLFGVDSPQQFRTNIVSVNTVLSAEIVSEIEKIHVKETELLNPVNWR
jgi:aryl-alcohol dehydrogenase-like predicted oxidoreductase